MMQNILGDDFATNRNLGMDLGSGKANKPKLADEEQLEAAEERRRLLAAGQQDIFGEEPLSETPPPATVKETVKEPVKAATPPKKPVATPSASRILRPTPQTLSLIHISEPTRPY